MAETPLDRRLRAIGGLLSVLTAGQDRLIAATTAATVGTEVTDDVDDAAEDSNHTAACTGIVDAEVTEISLIALPISASFEPFIPQEDDATPDEALSEASAPAGAKTKNTLPAPAIDLESQEIRACDAASNQTPEESCEKSEEEPEQCVQEDEPAQHRQEEMQKQEQQQEEAVSAESQGRAAEANSNSALNSATNAAVVDDNEVGVCGGFSSIVGSLAAKDALLEAVVLPLRLGQLAGPGGVLLFSGLRQAGHVLLYGPPGTGKTTLAAAAVNQPHISFSASRADAPLCNRKLICR
jgi:SpoVK/Ycf46/Vps4 family AAA+-type ATPase